MRVTSVILLLAALVVDAAEEARVIKVDDPLVNSTLLGFNAEPYKEDQQKALSAMHAATIRIGGHLDSWDDPKGQLDAIKNGYKLWERDDALVNWCAANGLKPMYLLCYAPHWSNVKTREKYKYPNNPNRPWEMSFCPPDDPAVWKEISKAMMNRYKGKVFHYEVWNEPNTGFYFQGEGGKQGREELLQRYVDLCKATFEAARETDPAIKVYTGCPHNDFFGSSFLNPTFGKGLAQFSDGICLHIYVGPQSMAAFDNWWAKYLDVIKNIEAGAKRRFPLVLTEYGHNHKEIPERGGALSLAQATAMLGSFKVELMTQFTFFTPKTSGGDEMYAVFRGNFEDNATTKTLRHVYALFKDARYAPLNGAKMSPGGEVFNELGVPAKPDNKFYAFEITKPDGSRAVYVAAWRGRFSYTKNKPVDIPDMEVKVDLPGIFDSAEEIDSASGELKPYKDFKTKEDRTEFSLTLQGIKDGKEGWPRAFVFRRAAGK